MCTEWGGPDKVRESDSKGFFYQKRVKIGPVRYKFEIKGIDK